MMKKIFVLVLFLVLGKMWGYAQYPIQQFIGADSALVTSKGGLQGRLINWSYSDTGAANNQRIKAYPGAQIATINGGLNLWVRNATATAWLPIALGSGNNIYTIDGTLLGNRELNGDGYELLFETLRKFGVSGDTVFFNVPYQEYRTGTQKFILSDTLAKLTRAGKASFLINSTTGAARLLLDPTGPADEKKYELNAINEEFWIAQLKDDESAADTLFFISNAGNVGIGTTSPTQKLQVAGNTYVTGQFAAGDTQPGNFTFLGSTFSPSVLAQKTVSSITQTTDPRTTGVMGSILIQDSLRNRVLGGHFSVRTDSANNKGGLNNAGQLRASQSWVVHDGTGTIPQSWGSYNVISNRNIGTLTNAYGSVSGVENFSTGAINKLHGQSVEVWNNAGGSIDTVFGQTVSVYNNNAASNIGAVYGLSIGKGLITPTGGTHYWRNGGTINSSYGLYLDTSIDVGINKYAIYSFSRSNSYFNGNVGVGTSSPTAKLEVVDSLGTAVDIQHRGLTNADIALNVRKTGVRGYAAVIEQRDSVAAGTQYGTYFRKGMMPGTGNPAPGGAVGIVYGVGNDNDVYRVTSVYRSRIIDTTGFAAGPNVKGSSIELWTVKNNAFDTTLVLNQGNVGIGTGQNGIDSNLTVQNGAWFERGVRMSGLPQASGIRALRVDASGTLSLADTLTNGVSGSGTTNYISKFTGANTIGNSIMQEGSNSIGIGTTPNNWGSSFKALQLGTVTSIYDVSNSAGISNNLYNDGGLSKYITNNYATIFQQSSGKFSWLTAPSGIAGNDITFNISMVLDDLGNLGIGTPSPDSMLTVAKGTNFKRGVRMSGLPSAPGTKALRINASGTISIADTLVDAGGTVTSVATNTGTGITGGTITTTGTLAIDTALISTRLWRQKGIDSVQGNLTAGLATKLNISDTASMLSPYARTNVVNAGLALKVNISDTASMLTPYLRKVDTTAMLSPYKTYYPRTAISLTTTGSSGAATYNNSTGVLNIPIYTDAYTGTVTSVATNNGTGITGGTITTSGTLAIDTFLISTRAWRQKGIDSVQGNLTSGLALKVNISDTASMLSPYLRSNVAAASYVPLTRTITINGTSQDLSANRTYNVGTVTSVATNTGTGITGGTFTTSGTIAADTLLLSTRAWRQKGVDSVAALISSNISGTTNYIPKFTSSSAIGNSQIFDNGTNVGIGVASNLTGFSLVTNGNAAFGNGWGTSGATLEIKPSSTSTNGATLEVSYWGVSGGYGPMIFRTNNAEQMRLTSTGLGIGTTSPAYKLDVTGTGNFTSDLIVANGSASGLLLINPTETATLRLSGLGFSANRNYASLEFRNSDPSQAGPNIAAAIRVNATQADGSGGYFTFHTSLGTEAEGTSAPERMRLDASGNLGLGVTPSAWYTTFGTKAFQFAASGSVYGLDVSSSDRRAGLMNNAFINSSGNYQYINTGHATQYEQNAGKHTWLTAASGTAGNTISFTQAMTLNASGRLFINATTGGNATLLAKSTTAANITIEALENNGVHSIYLRPNNSSFNLISSNYFGGGVYLPLSLSARETNSDFVLSTTGNVGIGTTSPQALLHVSSTLGNLARIEGSSTGNATIFYSARNGNADEMQIGIAASGYTNASYPAIVARSAYVYSPRNLGLIAEGAYNILFQTNGSERMRITSGGSLVVGGTTADASAIVQITSTTKGFLPPVMTGAQAEAISATPAAGLLVYANNGNGAVITSIGWWGYNGTTWVKLN